MPMARRNIVAGLALLGFACWYAYLAGNLPERSVMPNTPGPSFFPILIVTAVMVLSVCLIGVGLKAGGQSDSRKVENFAEKDGWLAICAFVVYLAVLPYAGFIIASMPFFGVLMYLYGSRNWLLMIATSIVVPLVLYTVFRHGFQIVLPRGLFAF